jgi:hypothetical protein
MTPDLDHQATPLFIAVSETEQERITGGFGFGGNFFFFQQTDIMSFANQQNSFAGTTGDGGNVSGTSTSNTGYRLSQTTLAFGGFFGGGRSRYGFSPWLSSFNFYQNLWNRLLG